MNNGLVPKSDPHCAKVCLLSIVSGLLNQSQRVNWEPITISIWNSNDNVLVSFKFYSIFKRVSLSLLIAVQKCLSCTGLQAKHCSESLASK